MQEQRSQIVCFIALTLAGSLRRCLKTQPIIGHVFKKHPRNRQVLMHEKTCVIPV